LTIQFAQITNPNPSRKHYTSDSQNFHKFPVDQTPLVILINRIESPQNSFKSQIQPLST